MFKGPVRRRKGHGKARSSSKNSSSTSTSHTRYSASPGARTLKKKKTIKVKQPESSDFKRRSAKSYVKKKAAKTATAKVKSTKVAKVPKPVPEVYVGEITHFFSKISVVVLKVEDQPILIADTIHVKGSVDFIQKVQSLQVESKDVRFARKGELVGLQVIQPAKPGDKIYKIKK